MHPGENCSEMTSRCCAANAAGGSLPVWKRLAYGVGCMAFSMCNGVLGINFNVFLLEVVIIDPVYVTIIMFGGYVWDAITSSAIGYLTSFTKTTFGRLRPWMGFAMIPAAILYFLLWSVPPSPSGQPQHTKFIYYLVLYFACRTALSCIYVPYNSLIMHISDDNKERDSAAFFRVWFEQTGNIFGILILFVFHWSIVESSDRSTGCNDGVRISDRHSRNAYQWHAFTVGVLVIVCTTITIVCIQEQKEEIEKSKRIGFVQGLREICSSRSSFSLLMMNGFLVLAFQFVQNNVILYLTYSVGLKKEYPFLVTISIVSGIIWTIPLNIFSGVFGKKTVLFVALWIYMPVLILALFLDYFPQGTYVWACFVGIGLSSNYFFPWSMLPDVIDEAALRSDVRHEELFYAFLSFVSNISGGFGAGISALSYKISGYDENACEQPWTVPLTLKLLLSVPTILSLLTTLLFLHFYPITEETRRRTKQLLMERRDCIMNDGNGVKSPLRIIGITDKKAGYHSCPMNSSALEAEFKQ